MVSTNKSFKINSVWITNTHPWEMLLLKVIYYNNLLLKYITVDGGENIKHITLLSIKRKQQILLLFLCVFGYDFSK